jgi:hypothetical protein
MLTLNDRLYDRAAQFLYLLIALVIVLTFQDYGITWDEELQSQYGLAVVDYYQTFFKDHRFAQIFNLYLYGGMFDGLASLIDSLTPFTVYETRHFINALFGLMGIWGTYRVGKFLGGGFVGFAAAIILTLTPMYYGHMFNNPKDIPFATGVIWSIYYMARIYQSAGKPSRGLKLKLGLICGLTLGIRVGGAMLVVFWIMPYTWDILQKLLKEKSVDNLFKVLNYNVKDFLKFAIPIGIMAYVVMLVCWPWAQQNPILNPLRALSEFSNFPQDVEVLLNGTVYRSTQLPWYYVPLYFAVQLPEFLLLLLSAWLFVLPSIWRDMQHYQKQALVLILLMAVVPVVYAVLRHPALYDAVRHFLFTVPLGCIVAALTLHKLFRILKSFGRVLLGCAFVAFVTVQIVTMVRLHPYEYIYANQFTGGTTGAYGQYESDYWGTSFKEAAEQIQAQVIKEGGIPSGKIYRIAICGPWDAAMIYLPPDFEPVVANEPAEFFLSTTRWMCQNMRAGKEIIRIQRLGVPLSVVKDLR